MRMYRCDIYKKEIEEDRVRALWSTYFEQNSNHATLGPLVEYEFEHICGYCAGIIRGTLHKLGWKPKQRVEASPECVKAPDGEICQQHDHADPAVVGFPPYRKGCTCVVVDDLE